MAGSTKKGSKNSKNTVPDIENIEWQSLLYDFYGALLKDSQNEVMALYHEDNLSLSEIASELGMSRQAVHYTLKKAEHALCEYEEKLGLVAGYHRGQELAARARNIIESGIQGTSNTDGSAAAELLSIIDKLAE